MLPRRALLDAQPDRGAAGERDHVDVGRLDQRLADRRARAADEVHHAGRQHPSTMRQSSATPSGSTGAGFTTTVLPHASAGPILPAQFVIGKLYGRDAGDDADRLAHGDAEGDAAPGPLARRHRRVRPAASPARRTCASRSGDRAHLLRLGDRPHRAGLGDGQVDQTGRRLAEPRRRVAQQRAALGAPTCAATGRARTPRAPRAPPRAPAPATPRARGRRSPRSPDRSPDTSRRRRAPTRPPIRTSLTSRLRHALRRPG